MTTDEDRLALFRQFVARFRPETASPPPQPVLADDIARVEKALDAFFPASIVQFWLGHGCGEVPALAATSSIFPRPANCPPPLQRLLSPGEILREAQTPRYAPIPAWLGVSEEIERDEPDRDDIDRDDAWKYVLPIAVDARGRWICMMRHYNVENDLPIYHFDHQAGAFTEITGGFDDLLVAYLRLPQPA